ncbi:restriction endonuclease [Streptomyces sp. G5(2025)]|uniref:restriction endonuclease n=1 Tax=Streptomyces sp. G5(2025) TaxID=3406628 RepID=UPI003C26D552
MRRDGCTAERIGGAGDNACDVRATDPAGRVWAIQCKHRRDGGRGSAIGVGVLQQVNGAARQVHGADIAVVLTNGRFLEGDPLGQGTPNPPRRPPRPGRMGCWITAAVGPAQPPTAAASTDGTVLIRRGSWSSDPDAQRGGPAGRAHLLPNRPQRPVPEQGQPVADRVDRAGLRRTDRTDRVQPEIVNVLGDVENISDSGSP